MVDYDVAVIGAGAAGMMAAATAGQAGRRVVLLDHATTIGEKIRISGGGRCNFTNRGTQPSHFVSANPHFCKSALARTTPQDFLDLLAKYRVPYHEKHKGQLFCDRSSQDIIDVLVAECAAGQVAWRTGMQIDALRRDATDFVLEVTAIRDRSRHTVRVAQVIVATGGLSIPKLGATGWGYQLATQWDIPVVATRPGLVPLTFEGAQWQQLQTLAGLALPVRISVVDQAAMGAVKRPAGSSRARIDAIMFDEDLLFTHRGLSGPAILQISSYWQPGGRLQVDCLPGQDVSAMLLQEKKHSKKNLLNTLYQWLPQRLAEAWLHNQGLAPDARVNDLPDQVLRTLGHSLHHWTIQPSGSEGFKKAEVTCGGIDTRALSQQTMMAKACPGLYFVGEVVDVTGWLGGYNFQWAWASGRAAGWAVSSV